MRAISIELRSLRPHEKMELDSLLDSLRQFYPRSPPTAAFRELVHEICNGDYGHPNLPSEFIKCYY